MKSFEGVSSSKKAKNDATADVDHISHLPDDITGRILSCIPTVEALATCVLSKDWKYKWRSIDCINISDQLRDFERTESMFTDFVQRILLSHTKNIKNIRIKLVHGYNSSLVKFWIAMLLRNKIKCLDIDTVQEDLVIDGKHLDSSSLRELVLSNLSFNIPASNCFTNLKDLHLKKLHIRNESDEDMVSFTFPVLQMIELVNCTWLDVKIIEIHAPALKGFKSKTAITSEVDHYIINIHCSDHLGLFNSGGGELENIFVTGSEVVNATFENMIIEPLERIQSQVRRLLEQFSSTLEELTLSLPTAWAITGSKQGLHLPKLDKVLRLNLTNTVNFFSYFDFLALLEILHAMPSLKSLSIDMYIWANHPREFVSMLDSLPDCFLSNLEEIEFVKMGQRNKFRPPIAATRFLLREAKNLKRCRVNAIDDAENIMETISDFPTGSKSLEITAVSYQFERIDVDRP